MWKIRAKTPGLNTLGIVYLKGFDGKELTFPNKEQAETQAQMMEDQMNADTYRAGNYMYWAVRV